MKWSLLTLFPEVIETYTRTSILGRAQEAGVIEVEAVNPRNFSQNSHRKVDDTPYGGGSGMVLTCQPLDDAFQSLQPLKSPSKILLTSPAGRRFDHAMALELATYQQVVIFCGHYEGFDERIHELIPEMEEVSIGDFVLTGGELPALCIVDAVTRLLPGAVQKFDSVTADSFYDGLLDYPHYTRPPEYKGLKVPEVLMSGNHEAIAQWRRQQALYRTWKLRPDLLKKTELSREDQYWLEHLNDST